jgi:hypothetical protein
MSERRYLPTLAELIDRLSITQLKEVFIPEHKEEYAQEIADIVHDIQLLIDEVEPECALDAEMIRAVVVLSQMNLHIWHNESNARKGIDAGNNLKLTHGLNGIRNVAKNKIQEVVGGRKDYKTDCLAAEFKDWEISWNNETDEVQTIMSASSDTVVEVDPNTTDFKGFLKPGYNPRKPLIPRRKEE